MPDMSGINGVIDSLIDIFIEKKFFSIFSFLFGVGFIFLLHVQKRVGIDRDGALQDAYLLYSLLVLFIFLFLGLYPIHLRSNWFLLLPFYSAKVSTISKWLFTIITLHILALLGQMYMPSNAVSSAIFGFLGNDAVAIFIMFLSGFLVAKADWIGHIGAHSQK